MKKENLDQQKANGIKPDSKFQLPSDESIDKMSEIFGESMFFIEPKTSGIIGFKEGAKAMREYFKREIERGN